MEESCNRYNVYTVCPCTCTTVHENQCIVHCILTVMGHWGCCDAEGNHP